MNKRTFNLKDVAIMAGVSIGTASKVINGLYVKPALKSQVEAAVKELNYTPNVIARSLKTNSTKTIGIIVPDISNSITAKIMTGIHEIASANGYSTLLYDTCLMQSRELEVINLFKEKMVDGILFTNNTVSEPVQELFKKIYIPVVFVATKAMDAEFSSVTINNEEAAYTAVEHLLKLGHKKIAMLAGYDNEPNSGQPRVEGYKRALEKYGFTFDSRLVIRGGYHFVDGYNGMEKLMEIDKIITAVFCASDERAIGAIKFLGGKGIKVPDDISVVGFDGIDLGDYTCPSITTIQQPFYQFGVQGVKILLDIISKGRHPVHLSLDHKLVCKESCRSL
jgi:LacI family transcriptional regulator